MQDYDVPFAPHAEMMLISQLLLGCYTPEALSLSPNQICDPKLRTIYESCLGLQQLGTAVDVVSVTHDLTRRGAMAQAGGHLNLAELLSSGGGKPGQRLISQYVNDIRAKSTERDTIKTFDRAQQLMEEGRIPEAFRHMVTRLNALQVNPVAFAEEDPDMSTLLDKVFARMNKARRQPGAIPGTPSGFFQLDSMTGGFRDDQLIIVAARPGVGKTSLAMSVALNMADHYELPVVIFSLEMSAVDLTSRLVSALSEVPSSLIDTGMLNEDQVWKLDQARQKIAALPITIIDQVTKGATAESIRERTKRLKVQPRLVIIDYLGRMQPSSEAFSKNDQVDATSWAVKQSAVELQIPHLLLCQLNRGVEGRQVKTPVLSDLRDSGGIEQNSDCVWMVHREELHKPKDTSKRGDADIIVVKNRKGPLGTVPVRFRAETQLFSDIDSRHHQLQDRKDQACVI